MTVALVSCVFLTVCLILIIKNVHMLLRKHVQCKVAIIKCYNIPKPCYSF